jgi:hypothetical protein
VARSHTARKPAPRNRRKKVTVSAGRPVILEKTPMVPMNRAERMARMMPVRSMGASVVS